MLEAFNGKLTYDKLSKDEMANRGILGRLNGVIADGNTPTRNGRKYSTKLWENVFENPIVREAIDNRLCLGELGHPTGRTETDIEKVCICLNGYPKLAQDGKLYGNFDILDTPNGRILNTLCNYGANIGVSSRGEGDLYTDDYGDECVDEDTYQFECFDAVLIPAVESARMNYMTESLSNKKSLTEALTKELDKANEKDKRIMTETLHNLGLLENKVEETYKVKRTNDSFIITDQDGNFLKEFKDEESATDYANELEYGEDNGPEDVTSDEPLDIPETEIDNDESMMEELQEALAAKDDLEKQLIEVRKQLSVSNAKERSYEDKINKLERSVRRLSENTQKVSGLETRVTQLSEALEKSTKEIANYKANSVKEKEVKGNLTESLTNTRNELKSLKKEISSKDKYIGTLEEELENVKDSNESEAKLLAEQLDKQRKATKKYKEISSICVEKYIGTKAQMIGVSPEEIKNQLPTSYNFNDIDKICEGLRQYRTNISKLPFQVNTSSRIQVRQSKQVNESLGYDDDDDLSSLMQLAGLDK